MRFRGKEVGCHGCLRITVGTQAEVDKLIKEMQVILAELMSTEVGRRRDRSEDKRECEANDLIA